MKNMTPCQVENASHIDLRWNNGTASDPDCPSNAMLTAAKWCPLENCTVLVLGEINNHFFLLICPGWGANLGSVNMFRLFSFALPLTYIGSPP